MSSMLMTVWLILGALSYAAIVERAGFLDTLIKPAVARAKSTGALIATVVGTAIGLNIVAGDQYVAIVMPSRVYRLSSRSEDRPQDAVAHGGGRRDGHVAAGALEQLRGVHGGRARRRYHRRTCRTASSTC